MEGGTTTNKSDILSNPLLCSLLFCLPAIGIVVTGNGHVSREWRTAVWTAALCTMGAACIANAARCGRVHCYITGPFFLATAVLTLLYGLGIVPLGASGWNMIGLAILIGAIALTCLPELFFGKYRKGRAQSADRN
jgi:hypothetical protein